MTEKKPRKPRINNYKRDAERLSFYLETVIRIKTPTPDDEIELKDNDYRRGYVIGQLKAYCDIAGFIGGGK